MTLKTKIMFFVNTFMTKSNVMQSTKASQKRSKRRPAVNENFSHEKRRGDEIHRLHNMKCLMHINDSH